MATATAQTTQAPDINAIIAYESGELESNEVLTLFAGLIASGLAWSLQGHYGRTANALIENGYINRAGEVVQWVD